MLTPGIAGGIVMLITQSLSNSFQWPLAITAIALSFLVGLLVFITTSIPVWQRIVFYVLNSLIIFSVAVGTSAAASGRGSASGHGSEPNQVAAAEADLAKAKEQLTQLESSERQLKESIAKLAAENASAQKAAAELAKLKIESDSARKAVEASTEKFEAIKTMKAGLWIKKVF